MATNSEELGCSQHFAEDCFKECDNGAKRLIPGSKITIMPAAYPQYMKPKPCKARRQIIKHDNVPQAKKIRTIPPSSGMVLKDI